MAPRQPFAALDQNNSSTSPRPLASSERASMNEQEAIERMRRGDIAAMAQLVRRHQQKALEVATIITHDVALAQEVVQEAFVRFYERINLFDNTRPFRPYFLRMVANDAIHRARRAQREIAWAQTTEDGDSPLSAALQDVRPGPEEQVMTALLRERVWEALGHLSPVKRATVVMRYYLGMSEAEMADALAVRPGTVKWRLHDARERLREVPGEEVAQ